MKKYCITICIIAIYTLGNYAQIPYKYQKNETFTYQEAIEAYQYLAKNYSIAKLIEAGTTDIGKPLHLFVIDTKKQFEPQKIKKQKRAIILINNGIHAGEPCGVDASVAFAEEILQNPEKWAKYLENTVVCIVPVYNIDGVLNRGKFRRANQAEPTYNGFRANSRNLDLNRDFMKAESKSTQSMHQIFAEWQPEIFIDTHTTDGSDHQYTITLIPTNTDKLNPKMQYVHEHILETGIYKLMKQTGSEMIPYVDPITSIPDSGIVAFMDTPRYSNGYAGLMNTFAFITEAHVFKSHKAQVEGTILFLKNMLELTATNAQQIISAKQDADAYNASANYFNLNFKLDSAKHKALEYKGYKTAYTKSLITGLNRMYYDTTKAFTGTIKYFYKYQPTDSVKKPKAYLIPQQWHEVIDRLRCNGVELKRFTTDTIIRLEAYYIESFKSYQQGYEGRYPHYDTKTRTVVTEIQVFAGDYIAQTGKATDAYLVHALEPKAPDSFFNWNFFDATLQQKEYFSPFAFEEKALQILQEKPDLKASFEKKKAEDAAFTGNAYAQLRYIYANSQYKEVTHMRYPIFRLENIENLPIK